MRRVDIEGDKPGNRGRDRRDGVRPGSPTRGHLRRLALEGLERRELLTTTIPSASVVAGTAGTNISAPFALTQLPNASSPSVVVDPVDPSKLAASWQVFDTTNGGVAGQVTAYVQAAYSVDGGVSWTELPGDQNADFQIDPSQSQNNGPKFLTQTTNASIAFGRDQQVYLLTSTHNAANSVGVLQLQRVDLSNVSAANPATFSNVTLTNKQVYAWSAGIDIASLPTMAVDSNLPSFTDVNSSGKTVTQSDPFANDLYVSWASTDTPFFQAPTTFNPQTIKIVSSSDEGADFTSTSFVDDSSNANFGGSHISLAHYTQPVLAISQGSPSVNGNPAVPGGQVSIVYDDYGTGAKAAVPFDRVLHQVDQTGGTSATFSYPPTQPNQINVGITGTNGVIPQTTSFPIAVNITDPKFTSLANLDVTLKINYPNMSSLAAVLVPPTGSNLQPILLFANGNVTAANGITGANLGEYVDPTGGVVNSLNPGTTFDVNAVRSIRDKTAVSPYYGTYRPFGENSLASLSGATAAQLDGIWTLQITSFVADKPSGAESTTLDQFALDFTAGNNVGFSPSTGFALPEATIADDFTAINSPVGSTVTIGSAINNGSTNPNAAGSNGIINVYSTSVSADPARALTTAAQGPPILPSPSVAIDNTLGAYSPHQGRIYVTYTGRYDDYLPKLPSDSTTINMVASDDGGQSWFAIDPNPAGVAAVDPFATSTGVQVNDANATTDGYSGSTPGYTERGAFDSQVAVDQYTGTVVVSFFDTRDDPSRDRVATYVAVSNDGGNTFAPETYANPSSTAIDAITGANVVTGVIPDNESTGNGNREAVFGYGTHEGLAVADGKIIPVWASNQNLGSDLASAKFNVPLSIVSTVMTTAGGPRILSGTMGPVGLPGDTINVTRAADGSPVANAFQVTFDRPVDPGTFVGDGTTAPIGSGDVRVFYQDPYSPTILTNTTSTPTQPNGSVISMLSTSGHPNIPIVDGNLTISLAGYTNLAALVVTLIAPNGQSWVVPITGSPLATATTLANATFAFPANMVGGAVDGSYQLKIADTAGQSGTLKSWGVQLNGISTGLRVLSITPVPNLTDPQDNGTLGYTKFNVVFAPVNPNNGVATSVGTYSYVVRPEVSDRIRSVAAPILSTGVTNLVVTGPSNPAPLNDLATAQVTLSGHPNQFLLPNIQGSNPVVGAYPIGNVAVTVSASVQITASDTSSVNPSDIQLFLSTPDGEHFLLPSSAGGGSIVSVSNAQVLVPFSQVPLDGVYTLEAVNTNAPNNPVSLQIKVWQLGLFAVIQTPNLPAAPVIANAQPSQVPAKLSGTTPTTSSITLAGHPGKTIEAGSFTLSLNDTNVNGLTITLIAPGGQSFTLPPALGTQLNQNYTLPASFNGQPVDGQYRLVIAGAAGSTGLLNSWSISLTPLGLNGNAMDQNADGTPGQDPETTAYTGLTYGDNFSSLTPAPTTPTTFSGAALPVGPYTASSLPLIVAGAHVVTTNVTGTAGTTTGSTTNATVTNDQVGSIAVTFDRNVQIASVTPSQVLSIVGPAGPIGGPQTFTSSGIAKTFASTAAVAPISKGAATPLTSQINIFNTGLTIASLSVLVNITDPNDQTLSLTLVSPGGVRIPLSTNRGGTGANFTNTTFSDGPPANGLAVGIANGVAPFGLTYQPETPLGVLANTTLDGTWSLVIADNSAAGTAIGRLNSWSLSVVPHVPQGAGTSLSSSLTVSNPDGSFTIGHLAVSLNLTAAVNADAGATLIAPDGTQIVLFNAGTLKGANLTNVVFDDSATLSITQGTAPYSQTYRPLGSLSSELGKAIKGNWQLVLTDVTGDKQAVTLNSWSLVATPQIRITPQQVYSSTDTSTTTAVSTDTSTQVYSSVDATYKNPLTIGSALGSTVTSNIVVPSTGGTFTLANLNVALSITYAHDSNLSVSLTAPNGTVINLFAGVGGAGANFGFDPANPTGQPFDYTILGDSGSLAIGSGRAPFDSGSVPLDPNNSFTVYRPAMPLSVLNGLAIDGTWTLKITNGQTNGPVGQFNGWSLIARPNTAAAANGLPTGSTQPAEPIPLLFATATSSLGVAQPAPQPLGTSITFASTNGTFLLSNTTALSAVLTLVAPAGGNLADLTGVLTAPNGVQATLFAAGDGRVSGNGTKTFTLTPIDPVSGLPRFAGIAIDGTWTLRISDAVTADPADVLQGWSLKVTPQPIAGQQALEPVPNTPASSLTSTISIPDAFPVNYLRVRLNLTSPIDSNLTGVLIAPNGARITLFTNVGGAGSGFINTVFDDAGTTAIDLATAPFSGTYRAMTGNYLGNLAGSLSSAQGTWKLVITDTNPDGTQAVLNGWSLIINPPAGAATANTYKVSFPTQQLSGTYSLTLGSGITGASPSVLNPSAPPSTNLGTPVNPNLNAGVDILTGKNTNGTLATVPVLYNAAAVPVTFGKGTNSPTTLSSQIVVPDSFLVQGITAAGLPGLTVTLNITYPNDPDLSAVLIAPNGAQFRLFTKVGNGSNRANFVNTVLSDAVNPLAPIGNAGAPFSGAFNPQDPLSDFAGINAQGTWTLQITDVAGAAFAGTLTSWSLAFQRPLPNSGLGSTVADRQTVNFQVFNLAPTNPLANDTWTAVGPAGVTTTTGQAGTFAGAVATIAYDPSDPTRNTVYVGSASGGIWKTNNFLTSNPAGPTYVPLTDFGPDFGLDVGSIAVFGRNNDPGQSILFAGTGFAQATYPTTSSGASYSSPYGPSGRGVGILKSTDGGQTWSLLDSSTNVDASGNPLPESSASRDHLFVGDFTYKITVDPTPEANGNIIIYAAMGGPTGGLYRSIDSGNSWQLLSAGIVDPNTGKNAAATDVILDPASKSPTTGNLEIVYAAFQGVGVFISNNQGQGLTLLAGQLGDNPLIQGDAHFPPILTTVGNATATPNATNDGRIVLSKPALTGNAAEDLLYQDWIYAAVENVNGTFNGLYVTKDRGQNWTKAQLLDVPSTTLAVTYATPTNDNTVGNSYDPTANQSTTEYSQSGNSALSLTVDPTNPNIVYLGGTQDFQTIGLIRVDLTNMLDAHNFTSFSNQRNDGGKLTEETVGAFNVPNSQTILFPDGATYVDPTLPLSSQFPTNYLNLRHAPNTPNLPGSSPFNLNASLQVAGAASDYIAGATDFTNDGSGVVWTAFDTPLKANAGDTIGSSNLHQSIAFIDPVTGNVRLIFADDQGVFTAVVNPNGSLDAGIGTDVSANYSRNGNLQDEQFYYGAAQPSNVAAQAAGALFYASGKGLLAAQSDPSLLSNGNLTWSDTSVLDVATSTATTPGSPRATVNTEEVISADRGGVGIATDPTGGANASGPTGSGPSVYEYDNPSLGGSISDFFRVNANGQTTGLNGTFGNFQQNYPFGNINFNATTGSATLTAGPANNGAIPEGNFAVNPLNGSQILISSATGTLFETTTKGVQWLPIGQATNFGQAANSSAAYASAVAYGAPDPAAPGGIGNLNKFIYVGTVGGGIYATTTDGQAQGAGQGWINISSGLDGSTIKGIYPSPDRGSHEAYAVTLEGVYYTANSLAGSATVWTSITGNLAQIQHSSFGNAALAESVLSTFGAANGTNANGSSANLQYGGFNSVVADYRYAIPDVSGAVHPILYVSGYGGVFRSIDNGQSWTVFPNTSFDSAPVDGGYLPSVDVTNLQLNLGAINPATGRPQQVSGDPEVLLATTFGRGEFAIRLAPDVLPGTASLDTVLPAPGGSDSGLGHGNAGLTNVTNPYIDGVSEISNFGNTVTITLIDEANGIVLGTGTTDAFGRFSIQVTATSATDPSFFVDGTKNVGIQATDSSGAKGNVTTFTYQLKHTAPAAPGTPVLEAPSDSGRFNNDNLTNITNPTFDVSTLEPGTTQVELLRSTSATGPFALVNTVPAGANPVRITDITLASVAPPQQLNSAFYYETIQVDQAGNISFPSGVLKVTVNNIPPPPPTSIKLDPSTNSSGGTTSPIVTNSPNPIFDVTGLMAGDQLTLYRSINGGTPITVGGSPVGVTTVEDYTGIHGADGIYTYQVVQQDIYGNQSPLSTSPIIAINDIQSRPPAPSLIIFPADDTGAPANPGVTRINNPRFFGTVTGNSVAGLRLDLINAANGQVLATTTVTSGGTYQIQVASPLPDGTYSLEARTTNSAGNSNFSAPLVLTIRANPPKVVPSLSILPADDTGIKGDGVTANHRPRFVGTTDPGDVVSIYSVGPNNVLTFQASTTSSTVNGSFTVQLPNNLTDGNTQLVAQATDIAGNKGALSPALTLRIITVAGDYSNSGAAQLAIFYPSTQTYVVYGTGTYTVDGTPGRDIPVQYGFSGTGHIDPIAYRYNTAEYFGTQTTLGPIDLQYGSGGLSLPVSGNYAANGTFVTGTYYPNTATFVLNTPNVGGTTIQYGIPYVDIPVPAAYNGGGVADVAVFRPVNFGAPNGDTFFVQATATTPAYAVGFQAFGNFKYQAGDIPAPADYDGLGRDEFAIYRPTTGQFFIINAVNPLVPGTWTLRTVQMNLPGGPNRSDQPVVADYDGNGKADPTVFRPSNSTFYVLHTSTGVQQSVQFGAAGSAIAAGGPLMYRISALTGTYATTDGFPSANVNTSYVPTAATSGTVSAFSVVNSAIAAPAATTNAATTTSTTASASTVVAAPPAVSNLIANASPKSSILVGVKTPKVTVATAKPANAKASVVQLRSKAAARPKLTPVVAKPATALAAAVPNPKATKAEHHVAVAHAIQQIGSIKKGQHLS